MAAAGLPELKRLNLNEFGGEPDTSDRYVLKYGDCYGVFNATGDINPAGPDTPKIGHSRESCEGLYYRDTRVLSEWRLSIGNKFPRVQSAAIDSDNTTIHSELLSPEFEFKGDHHAAGAIRISRTKVLWRGGLYERVVFENRTDDEIDLPLRLTMAADFHDSFVVRGLQRDVHGEMLETGRLTTSLRLSYRGLDDVVRFIDIAFSREPDLLEGWAESESVHGLAEGVLRIAPRGEQRLYVRAGSDEDNLPEPTADVFNEAQHLQKSYILRFIDRWPLMTASSPVFEKWVHQNRVDLALLRTEMETGPLAYAGVPWYSVPMGRDSIITSIQQLWQDPELARGTLRYLAAHQADHVDEYTAAEPGRILHEMRYGELAGTGEVPMSPYYGSIDATPLYGVLAGLYYRRTGDLELIRELWDPIKSALDWIGDYGDKDGDGLVEYRSSTETGLMNQGWKDHKSDMFHADGSPAPAPITLCEVQGYAYFAYRMGAQLAEALGDVTLAQSYDRAASQLKGAFNETFWSDELGTCAMALDADKRPLLVKSSNPGHLLFTGILPSERAKQVADTLMAPDMFSGWGIRTLGKNERNYTPDEYKRGYHNGAVWPHDTAMAAFGMRGYGMSHYATTLLTAMFDAAKTCPNMRLPEVFCGYDREEGVPPKPYPVACSPQAWASGAESMLVKAALGLQIDAVEKKVTVDHPVLPDWLDDLKVHKLKVADGGLSIEFTRTDSGTRVNVTDLEGGVEFEQL